MSLSVTLSASKIKTAIGCSWRYYSSYILKLPDKNNLGAMLGGITHIVLECLAHPKRKKLAKQIIKSGKLFGGKKCQGIKKLVYKHAHKLEIAEEENIQKIHDFVVSGLKHDFWGEEKEKPVETYTEKDFDFENSEPKYKIRGFIDRLFLYKNNHALIRDYKTSKEAYKGEEASVLNKQACAYVLAVKKLFPHIESFSVEFLFLKFDCNLESSWDTGTYQGRVTKKLYHNGGGKITLDFSSEDVDIFEDELEEYQTYLESFTLKSATKNYALNQPDPEDGSFGGKMMCGFAKEKGQLKKDGNPMFYCPFKFAMEYYAIFDGDEKVRSCFIEERDSLLHKYPPEKFKWAKEKYAGCPAHRK